MKVFQFLCVVTGSEQIQKFKPSCFSFFVLLQVFRPLNPQIIMFQFLCVVTRNRSLKVTVAWRTFQFLCVVTVKVFQGTLSVASFSFFVLLLPSQTCIKRWLTLFQFLCVVTHFSLGRRSVHMFQFLCVVTCY